MTFFLRRCILCTISLYVEIVLAGFQIQILYYTSQTPSYRNALPKLCIALCILQTYIHITYEWIARSKMCVIRFSTRRSLYSQDLHIYVIIIISGLAHTPNIYKHDVFHLSSLYLRKTEIERERKREWERESERERGESQNTGIRVCIILHYSFCVGSRKHV